MFNPNRVVDDSRNTFCVKAERLRKYARRYGVPRVEFQSGGTGVVISREDALAIQSDDPDFNLDEVVTIQARGRRTFAGVVFEMKDVEYLGMQDARVATPFFASIARHMLATFEEDLCECGNIMSCECPGQEQVGSSTSST